MKKFEKKLSIINIGNYNDLKFSQKKRKSVLLLRTNSLIPNRKSVINNNKNNLFFSNILKHKNQNIDEEYNKTILILLKETYNRTNEENIFVGDYLAKKFNMFKLLKDKDKEKYDVFISICHLKKYSPDSIVINYETIIDKLYFLFEGKINVYKRIYIRRLMSQENFMNYLNLFRNKENINKYNRIKDKNQEIITEFKLNNKKKLNHFFIEENKRCCEIEEGNNFGRQIDDNSIDKKMCDFMFQAEEDSLVLFFNIDYYKKNLDKIERKKFREEAEKFRDNFILFKHFSERRMIDVFKIFTTQTIYQDEYLYHQNEQSEYIYFITKGKFCKYVSFSFNWLMEYLNYIKDATTNIIYHLINFLPKSQHDLEELTTELEGKKLISPMVNEHLSIMEKLEEKYLEKYVYGVKLQEENINNNQNIFRIKLDELGIGDMPGIEDGLEFKNRYYSVKCISKIAEIKKIKISDFLKIIKVFKNQNNFANNHLLDLIATKKYFLYHQIIKNAQKLEINLTSDFDTKYNHLIEKNESKKTNNDKYLSIAAIKAKGYKYDLKEIFDKEIPIFPKIKKSMSDNYYLKNLITLKTLSENPNKNSKRLFKFRKQNKTLTLSLSNPNYIINNGNIEKRFLSEENCHSKIKFNFDKYSSTKSKKSSKYNFSLSTNYSKSPSVKKIKIFKSVFFNHKINDKVNPPVIFENSKNEINMKKLNMKCIESFLNKKFENDNKKYYLGNQFKKKLDEEKKKFNLITYKEYFNKKD